MKILVLKTEILLVRIIFKDNFFKIALKNYLPSHKNIQEQGFTKKKARVFATRATKENNLTYLA